MSSDSEPTTAQNFASTASDPGSGQEMSDRFKPLTAQRAVKRAVRGSARLVGFELALMTPPVGRVEATLEQLQAEIGVGVNTLIKALRELEQAGLIRSRRRGSVANVYTWTEAARTSHRAAGAPEGGGDGAAQVAERMRAAHRVLLGCYVEERARAYGLDPALGYADEHRVQWRPLCVAVLRWVEVYQAEGEQWADALERVCRAAVRAWLLRPGRDRWLIEHRHPLERMATDLDWVAGEMKLKRHKPTPKPTEHEQRCAECHYPAGKGHDRSCPVPRWEKQRAQEAA